MYKPPFTLTSVMFDYAANITEKIGQINNYNNLRKMPILRKNNRIQSVHSTLAIEANSLSLKQVKDVINGKLVIGFEREIREVKNAYKAYEQITKINPYSIDDLLYVHGILTNGLIEESGKFRNGNEGVFDEDNNCIFIAPKPDLVMDLINDLFNYIKENKDKINPLILSSVFHYEFVFIHPFSDGNGRMARLWQNIILSHWKEVFVYLPIESLIKKYQKEYYKVIDDCNNSGESTEFIEFMLKMIDESLNNLLKNINKEVSNTDEYVNKLLEVMDYNIPVSAKELMNKLNLKSINSFRKVYLKPALNMGLIKSTNPDKLTSKNQRYYKD
ncbi:MAG: Fic family protein [Bacilli bacterium]